MPSLPLHPVFPWQQPVCSLCLRFCFCFIGMFICIIYVSFVSLFKLIFYTVLPYLLLLIITYYYFFGHIVQLAESLFPGCVILYIPHINDTIWCLSFLFCNSTCKWSLTFRVKYTNPKCSVQWIFSEEHTNGVDMQIRNNLAHAQKPPEVPLPVTTFLLFWHHKLLLSVSGFHINGIMTYEVFWV